MMFLVGRYVKEVNYLFLKYVYDIKNIFLMNEVLVGVKIDFFLYLDSEKVIIFRVVKLINKDIFVLFEIYNISNLELKSVL